MMNINKYAFTLVEIIVTITILAILTTFGFVYFEENLGNSRDSKRVSDISSLEKNLSIYKTKKGRFPDPDNGVNILYSGATVWTQGSFGSEMNKELRIFGNEYPIDPQFDVEYTYSVTNSNLEFQLSTIIEGLEDEAGLGDIQSFIIPTTYADSIPTAYVLGNYNGFMTRVQTGGQDYFLASPSIITSDLTDTDFVSTLTNMKLVYHEFFNLPGNYVEFLDIEGGFNFNVSDPIIFSGSVSDLYSESSLQAFQSKLKYIYSTTPTESFDKYIALLEQDGVNKIKSFLTKIFRIQFKGNFNCFDILEAGDSKGNGEYTIDPDGIGGNVPYKVYCDMTTDGGGWTRVGDNHITYGDFPTGSGVVSESGSVPSNTITSMSTPISSGYAIHQTGVNSEYEIGLDNIGLVQPGYEIRMSAWVQGEDDGGWTTNSNPQAGYIFHNRIFYSDGTSSIGGPLDTLSTSGAWKYQQVRHKVIKSLDDFRWYVGNGAENTKDLYFTGLRLELFYR